MQDHAFAVISASTLRGQGKRHVHESVGIIAYSKQVTPERLSSPERIQQMGTIGKKSLARAKGGILVFRGLSSPACFPIRVQLIFSLYISHHPGSFPRSTSNSCRGS